MKSTTCIHEDVFISILEKMFCLLTEAGSHPYGCIGIFSTVANTVTVCTHGRCNAERVAELKEYLIDIKEGVKKKIPGTDRFPMATPHAIVAYQIGECVIASYSPAGDPWDEAVSATYGHYHRLRDIYDGAKPMIKNCENMTAKEIAEQELKLGVTPFIIERQLPNGKKERWHLSELEIVN